MQETFFGLDQKRRIVALKDQYKGVSLVYHVTSLVYWDETLK